jgi:hypothetical protein
MKLFIIILLCSVSIASAAEVQVQVVRHNRDVAAPTNATFLTNVIALLRRCSVESTVYAVKAGTWSEMLHSDSFVHVTFSTARKLRLMASDNQGWAVRAIDEILVPLPEGKWPAHIFARSGTNVFGYTKYDMRDLKSVALEPALQLSSVSPYSEMAKFPERQR